MKLLILIPAYNEEASIVPLIDKIKMQIPLLLQIPGLAQVNILVVNDGSQDATSALARSQEVNVLDLCLNLGIGGAVQMGYQYAESFDYDFCVQVDGDGQHNPADILQLLKTLLKEKVDLVIGSRYLNKKSGFQSTFMRRLGKTMISWGIWCLYKKKVTDPTSGFRMVGRRPIKIFAKSYPYDYPEPESLGTCLRLNLKTCETPVDMLARDHGQSSINFWKSIHYMVKILCAIVLDSLKQKK